MGNPLEDSGNQHPKEQAGISPPISEESTPVDPKREAATNALNGLDANLSEKILAHPELVDTLAWMDSKGKTFSPGLYGDIKDIDPNLGNEYLVAIARKDLLPETRVDRVIGTSEANAEIALATHRFEVLKINQAKFENEREVTGEEIVMIRRAEQNVNALRAKHGLPPVFLPPERVKMIDADSIKHSTSSHAGGIDIPTMQKDLIAGKNKQGMTTFDIIQHELIHAGSYQSLQHHEGSTPVDYRVGLEVKSRTRNEAGDFESFLMPLNEAVTEENARRFVMSISENDPELGHLATQRKKNFEEFAVLHKEHPTHIPDPSEFSDDFFGARFDQKSGTLSVDTSGYAPERKAMWGLFDKIYEKNPGAFAGKSSGEAREIMFDMATKAGLTGNILPFGRLMNDTFGRGTFHNYGHLKSAQEIEALVSVLDRLEKKEDTTSDEVER